MEVYKSSMHKLNLRNTGKARPVFYMINYFSLKNILEAWDPGHKCK